jgi:hypothetical protein
MPVPEIPQRLEFPTADDRLIWDVYLSSYHFPALSVADELGLFSFLGGGPASAAQVGAQFSLSPRAAEALLGVLTALGFLVQHQGRFHVTDVARNFLLPDSPYYWGGMFRLVRNIPITPPSLRDLLERDTQGGKDEHTILDVLEQNGELAVAFTQAMHSHSFPAAMGLAYRGDFSGVHMLLDMGGGSGGVSIALALRYSTLRCTVVDIAPVCAVADGFIAAYGLENRVRTTAVDMFRDPWPTGHDAVLFSNVWHDWPVERCQILAQQSFDRLPAGGHIYLHEMLLADTRDGPLTAVSFSMTMLQVKGKQYTAGELEDLLVGAGFTDVQVTPTYGYYALVSARKP